MRAEKELQSLIHRLKGSIEYKRRTSNVFTEDWGFIRHVERLIQLIQDGTKSKGNENCKNQTSNENSEDTQGDSAG